MNRQEIDRIWTLLGKCRQGDEHLKDTDLKLAWELILEPYKYEDVKRAVVAHFRESKFWPDVGEITRFLPPLPEGERPTVTTEDTLEAERKARRIRRNLAKLNWDIASGLYQAAPDRVAKAKDWLSWFQKEYPNEAKEVL